MLSIYVYLSIYEKLSKILWSNSPQDFPYNIVQNDTNITSENSKFEVDISDIFRSINSDSKFLYLFPFYFIENVVAFIILIIIGNTYKIKAKFVPKRIINWNIIEISKVYLN